MLRMCKVMRVDKDKEFCTAKVDDAVLFSRQMNCLQQIHTHCLKSISTKASYSYSDCQKKSQKSQHLLEKKSVYVIINHHSSQLIPFITHSFHHFIRTSWFLCRGHHTAISFTKSVYCRHFHRKIICPKRAHITTKATAIEQIHPE